MGSGVASAARDSATLKGDKPNRTPAPLKRTNSRRFNLIVLITLSYPIATFLNSAREKTVSEMPLLASFFMGSFIIA